MTRACVSPCWQWRPQNDQKYKHVKFRKSISKKKNMILAWNHEKDANVRFILTQKKFSFQAPYILFQYISNLRSRLRDFELKKLKLVGDYKPCKRPLPQMSTLQFAITLSLPSKIICCHVTCVFLIELHKPLTWKGHTSGVWKSFFDTSCLQYSCGVFLLPNADSASMLKLSLVLKSLYPGLYSHQDLKRGLWETLSQWGWKTKCWLHCGSQRIDLKFTMNCRTCVGSIDTTCHHNWTQPRHTVEKTCSIADHFKILQGSMFGLESKVEIEISQDCLYSILLSHTLM